MPARSPEHKPAGMPGSIPTETRRPLPTVEEVAEMDAGELGDLFTELFGGFWIGRDPGVVLAEHVLLTQSKRAPSGRRVLTAVLVMGDSVTADLLRKIPVAAMENSVNLSNAEARKKLKEGARDLPPLERQPGQSPEDFSRLVAAHYTLWASLVPHPAPAIASEHSVPVPTVYTWIREARLRGFLPPGNRKKSAQPQQSE
jgi:hypothetical protein